MKTNKNFFIFIYGKSRGGLSASAYFITDHDNFMDSDAVTCNGGALACIGSALERALLVAQSMNASRITICSDELTLEAIKENNEKILRRFPHVSFMVVGSNPAEKIAQVALLKRMGW